MMTTMTSPIKAPPANSPLEYAPARHARRRVRRIMRIVFGVTLIALIGSMIYWRAPLWAHAQLHIQQRKCTSYTQSPDVVIASVKRGQSSIAAPIPPCWTAYEATMAPIFPVRPPGANRFPALGLGFLHELTSPGGHQRIVAIHCQPWYLASGSVLQSLHSATIEPASFWSFSSRPVLHNGSRSGGYPVTEAIEMYAGQPDPSDKSKFTIRYTIEGKPGVVEGQLNDDDTVTLQLRKGSAMIMGRVSN